MSRSEESPGGHDYISQAGLHRLLMQDPSLDAILHHHHLMLLMMMMISIHGSSLLLCT